MGARIIDGKSVSREMRENMGVEVSRLKMSGVTPGLAVVLVGDDPASLSYVTAKGRACAEVGIRSEDIRLPADVAEEELLGTVRRLNVDAGVDGILVQLPLPGHIDEDRVIAAISPDKDVDGFHPVNLGRMLLGHETFLPCTPHGIIRLLERTDTPVEGAEIVVIGRSRIVGMPVANLLFRKTEGGNATVTVCHTRTRDLASHTRRADIVIAAAGRPGTLTGDMIREGAVVIDVGVNRVDDPTRPRGYRLVGDVDFDDVKDKAGWITPVPGGVGPMTITMLLENTLQSARRRAGEDPS